MSHGTRAVASKGERTGQTVLHLPVVMILMVAVACVAELLGPRADIYCGGLGGLVLGVTGIVFSVLVLKKHHDSAKQKAGRWDIWTLWALGFFVRVVLLAVLSWVFWNVFDGGITAAALTMACVFLTLHCWDTIWLYRKFALANLGRIETDG